MFCMQKITMWHKQSLSLLNLMHAIASSRASTCATILMHVKNSMHHLFMALTVWVTGMKKMKERIKTSNLIVDHFSLTFVNLSLA